MVQIFSRDIQLGHIGPIRSVSENTSYQKIVSLGIALSMLRTNFKISIIFSSNIFPLQIEIPYDILVKMFRLYICSSISYFYST